MPGAPGLGPIPRVYARLRHPLLAQLPFYTDDPAVTARGKFHFEFFNEYDILQLQYPNLSQNTANYKLNYGLPRNLELDVGVPYLAILRAAASPDAIGGGDTNLGIKWEFRKQARGSHVPALGTSLRSELDFEVNRRAETEIQGLARRLSLSDEKRRQLVAGRTDGLRSPNYSEESSVPPKPAASRSER